MNSAIIAVVIAVIAVVALTIIVTVVFARRGGRQQSDLLAQHPGAQLVGYVFPFQPVRDAIATISAGQGGPATSPSYGSQRAIVLVADGALEVRLPKGDSLLLRIPADDITAVAEGELRVGRNTFSTIDLSVDSAGTAATLPLPFTMPTDQTQKPTREQLEDILTHVNAELGRESR
jgi:hypothetical protein